MRNLVGAPAGKKRAKAEPAFGKGAPPSRGQPRGKTPSQVTGGTSRRPNGARLGKIKNNNTIVQQARGKVVRQNATIVHVKLQPNNLPGMVRPMNPNVHTIAIPSQAPIAFPSSAVNRGTTVATLLGQAQQAPSMSASAESTPTATVRAFDNPFYTTESTPLQGQTPWAMAPQKMPPLTPDSVMKRFQAFNEEYPDQNFSSAAKKGRILTLAQRVANDTQNARLNELVNARPYPYYYRDLYNAVKTALGL